MFKTIFVTHYKFIFYMGKKLVKKSYPLNKFGSYLINKVLTKCGSTIKLDFGLKIINIEKLKKSKSIIITLSNYQLLEANDLLPSIYYIVQSEPYIKEFSEYKIIFCKAVSEYKEFSLHNNFLIGPNTSILDYYHHYKNNLKYLNKKNYNTDSIDTIQIKIWSVDDLLSKNVYMNKI